MRLCMMYKIAHTVVGDPWAEWLTTTKRVTRGFHAWKYIPIYSQHAVVVLVIAVLYHLRDELDCQYNANNTGDDTLYFQDKRGSGCNGLHTI